MKKVVKIKPVKGLTKGRTVIPRPKNGRKGR